MAGRLEGKIVLITGGSSGQGAAEARLFVDEGATVISTDIQEDLGREVVAKLGPAATFARLDVTSPDDWARVRDDVRERHGRLDVLVNNAGIGAPRVGRFDALTIEEHLRLFDVNVHGAYFGMRAMLPLLEQSGNASVINISSIDGLAGIAGVASYAASKTALVGLTKSIALEVGALGIRVNSIHPGVIRTPIVETIEDPQRLTRLNGTISRQALPRMGEPEEVAALALFLASDESSYCTGAQFTVDGGHLAGPHRDRVNY